MATLFISHSGDDEIARRIAERLKLDGFESLFLDFDPSNGIPGGRDWERELYSQLRTADAIVFVGGVRAAASPWCFAELALSRSIGKPIFPLHVDGGGGGHPLLNDTQWIDMRADGDEALRRLLRALEAAGLDPRDAFGWDAARPPFPGLASFEARDAAVFFGREREIDELVRHLQPTLERGSRRSVSVIGASGSGKSSLVRAGLVPRLQRLTDRWLVVPPLTPGEQPLLALSRALAAAARSAGRQVDGRSVLAALDGDPAEVDRLLDDIAEGGEGGSRSLLIVVDQAEELLTLSSPDDRLRFADLLARLRQGNLPVWTVTTLRSEFLSAFLVEPELTSLVRETIAVGALDRSALAAVIEGPGRRVGIDFEPGLVSRIVEDTQGGDSLPLLAYVLRQLYDGLGSDRRFTHAAYAALGGVAGAARRTADAIVDELAREGRDESVLPALLRLVAVDATGAPTRRRMRKEDFGEDEVPVVDAFVDARLLKSEGDGTETVVEFAHEAILRVWTPLSEAIERSREQLRLRSELERLAADWERGGCRRSYLLRDERLERIRLVVGNSSDEGGLAPLERAYLDESIALAESERRARRRRVVVAIGGLAAALVAVGSVAVLALWQRHAAVEQRDSARSGELAAQAIGELDADPVRGLLRAISADEARRTPQAADALRRSLLAVREIGILSSKGAAGNVAVSHDGDLLAESGDGGIRLWDLRAKRSEGRLDLPGIQLDVVAFSPNDRWLLTTGDDPAAQLWDLRTHRLLRAFQLRNPVWAASFSRDGHRVMAQSSTEAAVWDSSSGTRLAQPSISDHIGVAAGALSPNGEILATADRYEKPFVRLWNVQTGRLLRRMPMDGYFEVLAFSPDGSLLAATGDPDPDRDSPVEVWSVGTGKRLHLLRTPSGEGLMRFSPVGRKLLTAGSGVAHLWSLTTGRELAVLAGHSGSITSAVFSQDGREIATASTDGTARVWSASDGSQLDVLAGHRGTVFDVQFAQRSHTLATTGSDRSLRLWRLGDPVLRHVLGGREAIFDVDISPDGRLVATASGETARIWDARSGRTLFALRGAGTIQSGSGSVTAVRFSPGGGEILTTSRTAILWRAGDGTRIATFEPRNRFGGIQAARLHHGTSYVLTLDDSGLARLRRTDDHSTTLRIMPSNSSFQTGDANINQNGTRIAIVGSGGSGLWDAAKPRQPLARFTSIHADHNYVTFSPDGKYVAAAGGAAAGIWRASDGRSIAALNGHEGVIRSIAFSPDGTVVATASSDGTARIWRTSDGTSLHILGGDTGGINTANFSRDGRLLVTGSNSGAVRVWDAHSGRQLLLLAQERAPVRVARFGPAGKTVVTGSVDGGARIYDCSLCPPNTDLVSVAERRIAAIIGLR